MRTEDTGAPTNITHPISTPQSKEVGTFQQSPNNGLVGIKDTKGTMQVNLTPWKEEQSAGPSSMSEVEKALCGLLDFTAQLQSANGEFSHGNMKNSQKFRVSDLGSNESKNGEGWEQ